MTHRPRHLIVPMSLFYNTKLQPLDREVYGVIYWYSKMDKEKCFASNEMIAKSMSFGERTVHPNSVSNSISRLEKAGCVQVLLKPNKQRIEIVPLVKDEPLPEEAESSEVVQSNDGGVTETDVQLNDGAKQSLDFSDQSVDGGNIRIVQSDDGAIIKENNYGQSNDGAMVNQMMDHDQSNDGENININNNKNINIYTSSDTELEQLKNKTLGVIEDKIEKPKLQQPSKKAKTDTSQDEKLYEIINHWNKERGTKLKSITDIRPNAVKRLEEFTLEEVKTSISNIKYDEWWHPRNMQIETFFRFKDRHGEPVNYISRFLNIKPIQPTTSQPRPRHNFDQEWAEKQLASSKEVYATRAF